MSDWGEEKVKKKGTCSAHGDWKEGNVEVVVMCKMWMHGLAKGGERGNNEWTKGRERERERGDSGAWNFFLIVHVYVTLVKKGLLRVVSRQFLVR
jgi:hypothetical protein